LASAGKPGRTAWQTCGVSVTYYEQKAELPGIKEAMPEYADVHGQVLQDVVLRVDSAFQAFFRRIQAGETPGYPRFHGRRRYTSLTYPQFGHGAALDNGFLVLSKLGRIAVRWSRPVEGAPKTVTISQEADGWYVCFSCADAPHPAVASDWTGDWRRPRYRSICQCVGWDTHMLSGLVSQSRACAENGAAPGLTAQEGRQPQAQAREVAGESASDSAPPAAGLSPQDGAGAGA
jgi:hypothetical protein